MAEFAAAAIKMGMKAPPPVTSEELLAKQFASAEREETNIDKKTNRPYRANLAYSVKNKIGEQTRSGLRQTTPRVCKQRCGRTSTVNR